MPSDLTTTASVYRFRAKSSDRLHHCLTVLFNICNTWTILFYRFKKHASIIMKKKKLNFLMRSLICTTQFWYVYLVISLRSLHTHFFIRFIDCKAFLRVNKTNHRINKQNLWVTSVVNHWSTASIWRTFARISHSWFAFANSRHSCCCWVFITYTCLKDAGLSKGSTAGDYP